MSETDHPLGACSPWALAKQLGIPVYDWQCKVMADVVPVGSRVSLRAANGSGKTTSCVAPLVLWHLLGFKNSVTVITSGSFRQVEGQLFPAMTKYRNLFKGWDFTKNSIKTPWGSKAVGFSTNDPGKFEGWHCGQEGHDKEPLLMIIDEAKTVENEIFEAMERCQSTRVLLTSLTWALSWASSMIATQRTGIYIRRIK